VPGFFCLVVRFPRDPLKADALNCRVRRDLGPGNSRATGQSGLNTVELFPAAERFPVPGGAARPRLVGFRVIP